MSEQNYFEIVAVPVLQRKCQELFNSNMILETNLHMEITKARHNTEELQKLKSDMASTSAAAGADLQVVRAALEDSNNRIATLSSENSKLRGAINSLQSELSAARNELQEVQSKLQSAYARAQELEAAAAPKASRTTRAKLVEAKDDF